MGLIESLKSLKNDDVPNKCGIHLCSAELTDHGEVRLHMMTH